MTMILLLNVANAYRVIPIAKKKGN